MGGKFFRKVMRRCAYYSMLGIPGRFSSILLSGQYHGSVFKVALLQHWMVIVSGPKMVDELRRRRDDELSFTEGTEEVQNAAVLFA